MSVLDQLNENQRKAASTIDQHVRIIAGAGSGKTRVLMARIVYLVEECGIMPYRIMAITFTNKATNEMKERLYKQLGEDARMVRISTIHSLCVRILREDADKIGYPKNFTILDSDDQNVLLTPIYKDLNLQKKELSVNKVLAVISSNKSEGVSPAQFKELAFTKEQQLIADIYERYVLRLKEMKAMDFDDLLLEGERLLAHSKETREKWQNRLDYIHVDEFQDVDPVQYHIVRLLTGKNTMLCVVGDPDQTIYTWRGASVDIILRFNQDFPNCETIVLNQNYRSTQPILDASNSVISYNQKRIKKDLFTKIAGTEKIHLHACPRENDETIYVARQINAKHKEGIEYKDIAILYRSNYSSRIFERSFKQLSIPYVIYGGIRFYERQEIKDALCYLKLCTHADKQDPKQLSLNLAITRIINRPRRAIGAKSVEAIQEEANQRDINMLEVMKNPNGLSAAVVKKCRSFVELVEDLRNHREEFALEDFFDYVMDRSGYYEMVKESNEPERMENLQELRNDIAQSIQENPEMTLEEYLQEIALFTDKSQEDSHNSITLMTVHAAKGLEFDTVFLVNFNDGIFPSQRSLDEGGNAAMEEERRLCYVAMTRAKRSLYISWNSEFSYMLGTPKTPSRFLMEIPKSFVDDDREKSQPKPTFVQPVKPAASKPSRFGKYQPKDKVVHKTYGEGIILKINGTNADIAFGLPYGKKTISLLHPSLSKKSS